MYIGYVEACTLFCLVLVPSTVCQSGRDITRTLMQKQ